MSTRDSEALDGEPAAPHSAAGEVPGRRSRAGFPAAASAPRYSTAVSRLEQLLAAFVAPANRRAVLGSSAERAGVDLATADDAEVARLVAELPRGLRLFLTDPSELDACLRKLRGALVSPGSDDAVTLSIATEEDLLRARGKARTAAARVGFSPADVTRVVNVASQLASNMQAHAGGGDLVIRCLFGHRRGVELVAVDHGPGIVGLETLLRSPAGEPRGAGLRAARAAVDEFEVRTAPRRGTTVRAVKWAS